MKKIFIFILPIILFSCHQSKEKNNTNSNEKLQTKNIKVKTEIVKKSIFNKQILANGIIKATQKTNLHFKNSGYLEKIYVKNGQWTGKNKPVARLENQLLQNAVNKAKIARQKTKQKYQELLLSYNLTEDSASPETKTKLSVQSGLSQAENDLKEAQINYKNSFLYTPFSGIIANAQTTTGKLVSPSDTIATLINPKTYHIIFKIMENEVGLIHKGLKITLQSLSGANASYSAIIDDINPLVSADGTVQVKAKILDKNHPFIEGMHAMVTINIPVKEMILIPKKALVIRNDKDVVFTLHQNHLAKWHYVDIFGENTNQYAISKGLKEGDTIIISNNMNLAHDAEVTVDTQK